MSISLQNISKSYGKVQAVQDISFEVKEGEIFGLIGPDGAGKTTLFRILTTLLLADSGKARMMGKDVVIDYKYIRNHVGYMPGRFSLYLDLSVEENLNFYATIFGTSVKENYDLIKDIYVQIEPFKKRLARDLSGGMKQKLALSCALIHKPKVLFLDEPTTGVDPVSRNEFWEMLKRLQQKGISILISTPYMDEAALCDRIALLQEGKVLEIDTPKGITQKFPRALFKVRTNNKYQLIRDLNSYEFIHSVHPFGDWIHYVDKRSNFSQKDLYAYLKEKKHTSIGIESTTPTIEDTFMELSNT